MGKHLRNQARFIGFALPVLLLVGIVAGGLAIAPTAEARPLAQDTTVAITPAQVEVECGQTTVVDIRINNVEGLFGVDVKVSFDPNVVQVVDANPTAPGVQIQPGDLPDVSGGSGMVQVNTVDVGTGAISYAAIRLNPAPAQSGSGVIASIKFMGKAASTSPVTLVTVALSDKIASPIPATPVNGQIKVTCVSTPVPTTPGAPTAKPTGPGPTKVPPTSPVPPPTGCTHVVKPGETLYSIAAMYGVTVQAIMQANGLTDPNTIYIGQTLKIPAPGCQQPPPPTAGPTHPTPVPIPPPVTGCTHVVKPGETLYSIARLYGTTVLAIMQANGLTNPNLIFVGQVLTIPGCATPPPPPPGDCFAYTVKPFDTLSTIAMTYGDTVMGLAHRNGIVNPNLIYVGQVLTVCPAGGDQDDPACRYVHLVKPGETLYRIALYYNSSVWAIATANNLANPNLIYAGQSLCIP